MNKCESITKYIDKSVILFYQIVHPLQIGVQYTNDDRYLFMAFGIKSYSNYLFQAYLFLSDISSYRDLIRTLLLNTRNNRTKKTHKICRLQTNIYRVKTYRVHLISQKNQFIISKYVLFMVYKFNCLHVAIKIKK